MVSITFNANEPSGVCFARKDQSRLRGLRKCVAAYRRENIGTGKTTNLVEEVLYYLHTYWKDLGSYIGTPSVAIVVGNTNAMQQTKAILCSHLSLDNINFSVTGNSVLVRKTCQIIIVDGSEVHMQEYIRGQNVLKAFIDSTLVDYFINGFPMDEFTVGSKSDSTMDAIISNLHGLDSRIQSQKGWQNYARK